MALKFNLSRFVLVAALALALQVMTASTTAAALAPGDIVITLEAADAVLKIDPTTGNRTVISAGANSPLGPVGSGPDFCEPHRIAVEPNGDIIVTDFTIDAVFRIDPETGDRTIISGCPAPVSCIINAGACDEIDTIGSGPVINQLASVAVVPASPAPPVPSLSPQGWLIFLFLAAGLWYMTRGRGISTQR